MILITGTELEKVDLPLSDMVEYQIENDSHKMGIKLKTGAKSSNCQHIYILEANKSLYTVTDELLEKITYFSDDRELISLLNMGATSNNEVQEEKDIFDEDAEPIVVEPNFERPKPIVYLDKKEEEVSNSEISENEISVDVDNEGRSEEDSESKKETVDLPSYIPVLDLEMANTELPESVKMIPNIDDDVDSLRMLLKTKDGIIAQKDGQIQDLKNRIDETYKLQEVQLEEVENLYKEKIAGFQETISALEKRSAGITLDEESSRFLKFVNYARSNKAIVKEGFSDSEKETIGSLHSKYTIFACGTGDSGYSMLKQIKKYLTNGHDCLVLDFCNDNYLASIFKVNSKNQNTMGLFKDDLNPISLLKDINGTKVIPTTSYNDIAVLSVDWGKLIRKIDDMASGKDVIMIFGSINNFNVRYTVSKLATLGKLCIFAKCSPIILSSLYSDVQFIPRNRVHIVALEYIDVVKTILEELSKYFMVSAFVGDVEWQKLDLKK